MSTNVIFAPNITTYATRTPYITANEFLEAGTGADTSQLVPGSPSLADQAQALLRVIARASAWADSLVYKVLAATQDTQAGLYRVQNDGSLAVPVTYTPLVSVTGVSVGSDGAHLTALPDLSGCWIEPPSLLRVPPAAFQGVTALTGYSVPGRRFVSVSYVNGWTCTTLAAAASAAATSITVTSPLGLYPGMVLTVDDGAFTELVSVGASYVPGAAIVPLASPLRAQHDVGVAASAMPQDIKQAVISLTSCLIKTRGSQAVVMASMAGEPSKTELSQSGGIEDFELAADLLEPYRRVW